MSSWIDRYLEQGLFHPAAGRLVRLAYWLNLVELFKALVRKVGKGWAGRRALDNVAIDIFIAMKWLLLVVLWTQHVSATGACITAWYFLLSNAFTYFYYHIWDERLYRSASFYSIADVRRRLLNSAQAFGFSLLVYAYMYDVLYSSDFTLSDESRALAAAVFSTSNALTVNYPGMTPRTLAGKALATSQLVMTVSFLVGVIAKTLGASLADPPDSRQPVGNEGHEGTRSSG